MTHKGCYSGDMCWTPVKSQNDSLSFLCLLKIIWKLQSISIRFTSDLFIFTYFILSLACSILQYVCVNRALVSPYEVITFNRFNCVIDLTDHRPKTFLSPYINLESHQNRAVDCEAREGS